MSLFRRASGRASSSPSSSLEPSELASADRDRLVRLLEQCASVMDPALRQEIVQRLPRGIKVHARNAASARVHLSHLVDICAAHPDGIAALRAAIHWFEGDTLAMQDVDGFLAQHDLLPATRGQPIASDRMSFGRSRTRLVFMAAAGVSVAVALAIGGALWLPEEPEANDVARPGQLVIDDVFVTPTAEKDHFLLDVRVRNPGAELINITRAKLHLEVMDGIPNAGSYEHSANYSAVITRADSDIAVAHILEPQTLDAFTVDFEIRTERGAVPSSTVPSSTVPSSTVSSSTVPSSTGLASTGPDHDIGSRRRRPSKRLQGSISLMYNGGYSTAPRSFLFEHLP